jgi:hypothetical protein
MDAKSLTDTPIVARISAGEYAANWDIHLRILPHKSRQVTGLLTKSLNSEQNLQHNEADRYGVGDETFAHNSSLESTGCEDFRGCPGPRPDALFPHLGHRFGGFELSLGIQT